MDGAGQTTTVNDALRVLERLVHRQERNVRDLVHDLRSPLTGLQLATETLAEMATDEMEISILGQMLDDIKRITAELQNSSTRAKETPLENIAALLEAEVPPLQRAMRGRKVTIKLNNGTLQDTEAPRLPAIVSLAMCRFLWQAASVVGDEGSMVITISDTFAAENLEVDISLSALRESEFDSLQPNPLHVAMQSMNLSSQGQIQIDALDFPIPVPSSKFSWRRYRITVPLESDATDMS